MIKNFVLDTNVLLHDIDAMYAFADNQVTIPISVIEELDHMKKSIDERGRNARVVSERLDKLRSRGKLNEGVKLDKGGVLKIELDPQKIDMPYEMKLGATDNRILLTALSLKNKGEAVIFISKDTNLRIKAEVIGLTVQDYETKKVNVDELYQGYQVLKVDKEVIDNLYRVKRVDASKLGTFAPNEFIVLRNNLDDQQSALAKYERKGDQLVTLYHAETDPWGIKPLNKEQKFALELLLCNDVNLVTLIGLAGSGKTLLSIACGLQKTVEEQVYRRLFICKPVVPMGRDIGFLPGTKEEKLGEWMGAIYDNLEFLFGQHAANREETKDKIQYLFDNDRIEIESLTYLRGRTLPQQYIIIDDAQNLTPLEAKTIISRAGKDTKVVLTGDPYQIDNPYLDASSNGLTYVVERFKGQELFGHVTFTKTERSKLAALAAELL
jgi:PhoH-like ATPase